MTANLQASSPHFDFVCPTCHKYFSFSDFTVSIIQQGLILLTGPKNCWFGCTCPFCDEGVTVIKKFTYDKLPQKLAELYNSIYHDQIWYYHIEDPLLKDISIGSGTNGQGRWEYNSFPYTFNHTSPQWACLIQLDPHQKWINDYADPEYVYENEPPEVAEKIKDVLPNPGCSYLRGSRITEPALTILWFTENEIDDLATFKTEEKKKVFPRYTLFDSTWEEMQKFCWDYRLELEFTRQMSTMTEIPLIEHLSLSSKKKVAQSYHFLNILDQPYPLQGILSTPGKRSMQIDIVPQAIAPIEALDERSLYFSKESRERITKKIWDHFNKEYIQDMLATRGDKFINEFVELSKSISFSRKSVWDLKEKFLREIHSAISSNRKRREEKDKDAKYWKEQAGEAEKSFPNIKIISQDPEINKLKVFISRLPKAVSATNFSGPILLLGEPGVGKTLFAEAIHHALNRKGEFKKIDCGSKSENLFASELFGHKKGAFTGATENRRGAFETAKGGTLFLDEIGNISLDMQQKLLGVLQDRKFEQVGSSETKTTDAFIIMATNENLDQLVEINKFRIDLFGRINQEPITITPLRERKKDIPLFFQNLKTKLPVDHELKNELGKLKYDWPGNVRELIAIIERIERHKIMNDDTSPICFDDLPQSITQHQKRTKHKPVKDTVVIKQPGNTKVTADQVKQAMENNNGNKTRAAADLGVTYHTVHRNCKKLGI